MAAHGPPRAVAGGEEGVTGGLPDEHVRRRPHGPGDDHRLAGAAVVGWHIRMACGQGPGRTLAVDAQLACRALDFMRLELGEVMGHVIDQLQFGCCLLYTSDAADE